MTTRLNPNASPRQHVRIIEVARMLALVEGLRIAAIYAALEDNSPAVDVIATIGYMVGMGWLNWPDYDPERLNEGTQIIQISEAGRMWLAENATQR